MIDFDVQSHKPLREIVYEELKRQIMIGEIPPGTRMMEVELAEKIGVSRTPVREAIRKLEKEGLISIEPRRGAYASDISIKDMVDVLEVRQTLEGMVASLAASKITEEEKDELFQSLNEYKEAVNGGIIEDIIKCDEHFHEKIVSISGNKTLIQMVSQIQDLALRFRYIFYEDFSRFQGQPGEHREIADAVVSGDSLKARECAERHVQNLKEFVIREKDKKTDGVFSIPSHRGK